MFVPFEKTGDWKRDDAAFKTAFIALLSKEDDYLSLLSNSVSFLFWYLEDVSWLGYYLKKDDELILGPFQGLPACTRIKIGKGVCGVCAEKLEILNVADVSLFPTYIACEGSVRSELVLPLIVKDELLAVLDLDSNTFSRFTSREEELLSFCLDHIRICLEEKQDKYYGNYSR